MLKIRTKDKAQFWIHVSGAEFLVEPMTLSEQTRMRKKYTTIKRGQEELDLPGFLAARVDRVIKAWKGVTDENGKPLPCDFKNKALFTENASDEAAEVLSQASMINGESEAAEEENLKK